MLKEIKKGIYFVGALDWDRKLFDELIPLPDGTSYNSYIVKGENKVALIDTVDPRKTGELLYNLKKLKLEKIDYIISNHAEMDHSGSIPNVLKLFPNAKVVTNKKAKPLLVEFMNIPDDKFILVEENDTVNLGGRTLKFIMTPWVHWPETMVTYLVEDKILFTCDFLASHIATNELFVKDKSKSLEASKRYYAEIMMPFRAMVKSDLKKVKNLEPSMIAPSHGQIHLDPSFIIGLHEKWVSDEMENTVLIPYVSMYESTQKLVNRLVYELQDKGINAVPINVVGVDIGKVAIELVDTATIVMASPTVLSSVHPAMAYVAYLANVLKPKAHFASLIGSYGWGGREVDNLIGMLKNLKLEFINPVLVKGTPKEEDFKRISKLADDIFKKHMDCELIEKG